MAITTFSLQPGLTGTVPKAVGSTFGTSPISVTKQPSYTYANGSGVATANFCYATDATVTAGTPLVLDLVSGLTDPSGAAIVFADIVAIEVVNNSSVVGQTIQIGGGTSCVSSILGASGVLSVLAGGAVQIANGLAAGYAINSTTGHFLNINVASGTSVPFSIAILGH